MEKRTGNISVEKLHEKKTEKNLGVNGWLAQRWILNIQGGSVWTEFIWLLIGNNGVFFPHYNESSGSTENRQGISDS